MPANQLLHCNYFLHQLTVMLAAIMFSLQVINIARQFQVLILKDDFY